MPALIPHPRRAVNRHLRSPSVQTLPETVLCLWMHHPVSPPRSFSPVQHTHDKAQPHFLRIPRIPLRHRHPGSPCVFSYLTATDAHAAREYRSAVPKAPSPASPSSPCRPPKAPGPCFLTFPQAALPHSQRPVPPDRSLLPV